MYLQDRDVDVYRPTVVRKVDRTDRGSWLTHVPEHVIDIILRILGDIDTSLLSLCTFVASSSMHACFGDDRVT